MKTLLEKLKSSTHQSLSAAIHSNWEAVLELQKKKATIISELEKVSSSATESEAKLIRTALNEIGEIEQEIKTLAESEQKVLLNKSQKHIKSKNALKAYRSL